MKLDEIEKIQILPGVKNVRAGNYIKFRDDFTKEELIEIIDVENGWAENKMRKSLDNGYIKVDFCSRRVFVSNSMHYSKKVFSEIVNTEDYPEFLL